PAKPDTLLFNKVTMKNATQAVQMFGPAQAAVARAVVDSVSSGVIPRDKVDDYCILVGVFIHWQAKNDKKIFDFNYRAVKESIERALKNRSEEHTSELQSRFDLVCRLLLEKKKNKKINTPTEPQNHPHKSIQYTR